ncbi:hypothetical protein GCM10010885_10940 [Alicyclobacillus cellulosilyticus]|uniref:histidine kinase n=1 Tax=Alicyclobacillus cellulosilyticus TaxID=1003997 RepID=A0A917K748_9BACL|nr:ATP-binding protein [Alicyclobacillus cellulosilyticus]GGJ03494.1 hypothetical protein GCM10010885_10940 [Alicyclobacillus cellulosilyticus]
MGVWVALCAGAALGALAAGAAWYGVCRVQRGAFAAALTALWAATGGQAREDGAVSGGRAFSNRFAWLRMGARARRLAELAAAAQEQVDSLRRERDVLVEILQRMTTGVVYLDAHGQVRLINHAAERMFRRPAAQCVGAEHWAAIGHYTLCTMVDRALLFGEPWQGELQLRDDLRVMAHVVPLTLDASPHPLARHALVLVNDVSQWHRLERMRSDFVANVSHELKTPITAIRGFVETLLEGDVDPEAEQEFLRVILDEAVRMEALVADLLTLSKLEAEDARVQLEPVPLAEVVQSALVRVQGEAARRGLAVRAEGVEGITVWADEGQLLQVLLNLLTNAIHYTPAGGEVRVYAERLVDRVKVHVVDTGIGIAPEHLPRIFERFYRVDKDRSRLTGGTGLGLAIVKHIVSLHGGEVGVASEPGKGSDFWFTLAALDPA